MAMRLQWNLETFSKKISPSGMEIGGLLTSLANTLLLVIQQSAYITVWVVYLI